MKSFIVALVLMAAVSAHHQEDHYNMIKQKVLSHFGMENFEFGDKMKCIENQLVKERHDQIMEKVKAIQEFYESHAERRNELIQNPDDLKIDLFHQMCPKVQEKIAPLIDEINGAIQFCRGDKAEASPFLPALFNSLFDKVCKLNKDQLVSMMQQRGKECYFANKDAFRQCAKSFSLNDIETVGFCGIRYNEIFGCVVDKFDACPEDQRPLVSFSRFMLDFFKSHCDAGNSNTL